MMYIHILAYVYHELTYCVETRCETCARDIKYTRNDDSINCSVIARAHERQGRMGDGDSDTDKAIKSSDCRFFHLFHYTSSLKQFRRRKFFMFRNLSPVSLHREI